MYACVLHLIPVKWVSGIGSRVKPTCQQKDLERRQSCVTVLNAMTRRLRCQGPCLVLQLDMEQNHEKTLVPN